MNFKKRILVSVFLPLMLFFVFVGISQNALADGAVTININSDVDTALIMKEDGGSNYYSVDNGSTWIEYEGKLIITGNGSETSNCIEVQSGTHDITLSNVIIKNSDGLNILKISGGTVNLTLSGNNELSSTWDPAGKNAINVTGNSTLNINGTDNDTLTSDANRSGKKIYIDSGSTVDIKGGNITLRSTYVPTVGGSGTFILDSGSVSLRPDRGNWFDSATNVQINGGYISAINTTNFGASSVVINGGVVDLNKGVMDASSFSMTNGVLYAASVTDKTNQNSWNGIVFEGENDGKIYGSNTVINSDCTIMPGKILYIESGQTLTVESGTTVTNNGTIIVHSGGILKANESGYGTVTGAIRREPVTAPSININDDVATALVLRENNGTLLNSADNGKTWTEYTGTMTVSGNGNETEKRIEVQSGTHDIVLSGVKIKALGNLLKISDATVNLALSGDNELSKNWEQNSTNTIYVTGNSTLNISGTNSDKLFSDANNNVNNIYIDSSSKVDIKGGNIKLWSTKKATVGGSGTFILDGGNVWLRPDPSDYNWFDSATNVQISGGNISATNTTNFGASSVVIKGGLVNLNGGAMNASNFSISNGVLYTVSITDKTNQSSWNGTIFKGDYGNIYGSPVINSDCAFSSGKILYIESGETLTVESGTTVTNNGTIIVHSGGTLNANESGCGTVTGAICTEPATAAPSININNVDKALVLKENNGILLYSSDNGKTWNEYSGTMTVTGNDSKTTNRIEVQSGTHDIKLDGVSVETDNCAFNIKGSATANVTLSGDSTLTSGNGAGLNVASGSSLVITSASTGSLIAKGSSGSAGIGSSYATSCGNITIEGGHIIATAGAAMNGSIGGAGIGSGGTYGLNAGSVTCGDITIRGGYVEATGSSNAAGIGTGAACFKVSNNCGNVTITGGTIKGTGYVGIGAGKAWSTSASANVNAVYISGGNVNATVSKQPVVSDSDNTNVYLTTVTLDGLTTDVTVSDITINATYNIEGINTLNSGKLYLYLPENTTVTKAVADGTEYKYNTIKTTTEGTEGTLYSSPKIDPNVNIGSDVTTALLFKEDSGMKCYSKDNGVNWVPYTGMFTVTGTTENRIEVQSGTHDITLSGASIKTTSGKNALKIAGGTVNLTLSGENNLSAAWEPGLTNAICLTGNSTLNIKGTGNDTLTSDENRHGNNINIDSGSTVDIKGGNITLRSSYAPNVAGAGTFILEGGSIVFRPDSTSWFDTATAVQIKGGSISPYDEISFGASTFGADSLTMSGGLINMYGGKITASSFSMSNGIIYASSITDIRNQSSWNGVVFKDGSGEIYGTPVINSDCELLSKNTLNIKSEETLSVGEGFAVTNNGTIAVYSGGTLNANKDGYGTVDKGIKYASSTDLSFALKDSSVPITMAVQESTITIKAIITKADTSSGELTGADGTVDFYLGDSDTGSKIGSSNVTFESGVASATLDITLHEDTWSLGDKTITAVYKDGTGLLNSKDSSSITVIIKDISVNLNDDVTTALLLKEEDGYKYYSLDNGVSWTAYVGKMTINGNDTTENTIEVQSGTHDITLNGVNIATSNCAFNIAGSSTANITVLGNNALTSGNGAGLNVTSGSNLVITSASTGSLTATGSAGSAGIGSGYATSCGNITIEGGHIIANAGGLNSGSGGAGIGTGGTSLNINCGEITITGGYVEAKGAVNAAGIGLGSTCFYIINAGGNITVTGGTINATGYVGIGEGKAWNGATAIISAVYISGGNVNATVSKQPVVSDSDNTNVYLTTVTLDGLTTDTAVSDIDISTTYNIEGINTLNSGKLYLYLPDNTTVTKAVVNDTEYKYNTIKTTTKGTEGTLYAVAKENQSADIGTDVTTALLFKEDSSMNCYSKDNGVNWVPYTGTFTITGTTTENRIEVISGTHDITLNGVQIDLNAIDDACAFSIAKGKVNLTLLGDNTLQSGSDKAGLEVSTDAELSISEDSTGCLNAKGGRNAAGIGGSKESDSGTITINGGAITAQGGESGAGIGGGYKGIGGNIKINGDALVIAKAGDEDAQDIGSGKEAGEETTPIITKGIVFKGNAGLIYGEPIIGLNCSIPEGRVLTVDNEKKLEVKEGNIISNNGVINMKKGSAFNANKAGYGTVTGKINFVPSIVVQPSAQTVHEDQKAKFTIQASGATNYRWQVNKNDGNGWIDISEGTDNWYTTEVSRTMYGYKYRCIAYNDAGSVTSSEVLLKVLFDYKIIDGANQTVTKGNSAKFSSDASVTKFKKVQVDGEDITAENYTVSSGSTVITLKTSYINTLSEGTHTLNIFFSDAKATTTFIVKAAKTSDNPDNSKEGQKDNSDSSSEDKKDNSGNSKEDKKDSSDNPKDATKNKSDQTKKDVGVKGSNAQQNIEHDAQKSDDSNLENPIESTYPTSSIEGTNQNTDQKYTPQPTSTLATDLQAGSSSFTSMLPIILICIGAAALVVAFIMHNSKK